METQVSNSVSHFRILLTEEELQLPALDDVANKFLEWVKLSKESTTTTRARRTRAANRRVDQIYDEILETKQLPPIQVKVTNLIPTVASTTSGNNNSSKSSIDEDDRSSGVGSSGPPSRCGRTLRPRCRTPSMTRNTSQSSPKTPTQQSLRAQFKKENVLSAALNQEHPSVSVSKIRQLLRADSAQKRRDEEKERQERMLLDRKAKEERAELQKKQLLEERAINAKLKREQRLKHAAEVRQAREKAKQERKALEEQVAKDEQRAREEEKAKGDEKLKEEHRIREERAREEQKAREEKLANDEEAKKAKVSKAVASGPVKKLNETFQQDKNENIDISIQDETQEEQKAKSTQVASWAKAPHLRDAIIQQFSRPEHELLRMAFEIFLGVKLPVDLNEIFGSSTSVHNRYLHRTSSAVWSSPKGGIKRTSSMVMTPTDPKR